MKFCKDCKFITYNTIYKEDSRFRMEYAQCGHPTSIDVKTDLVSGLTTSTKYYCSTMRSHDCGKDAKLFEEREGAQLVEAADGQA